MVAMAAAKSSPGEPLRRAASGNGARDGIGAGEQHDAVGQMVDGDDRLARRLLLFAGQQQIVEPEAAQRRAEIHPHVPGRNRWECETFSQISMKEADLHGHIVRGELRPQEHGLERKGGP